MISMTCPSCGRNLKVPDKFAGQSQQCPACKNIVVVPEIREEVERIDRQAEHRSPPPAPTDTIPADLIAAATPPAKPRVVPPVNKKYGVPGRITGIVLYVVGAIALAFGLICVVAGFASAASRSAGFLSGMAMVQGLAVMFGSTFFFALGAIVLNTGQSAAAASRMADLLERRGQ